MSQNKEKKRERERIKEKNFAAMESTRKRKRDDEKNEGMMGVLRGPFIAL